MKFRGADVCSSNQVKHFLKECKNSNYTKKLKPLLEKIEEVSKMMSAERSKCGIALSDKTGIATWESNMRLKSNALITFYESWRKINEQKASRKIIDDLKVRSVAVEVHISIFFEQLNSKYEFAVRRTRITGSEETTR